MYAVTLIGQGDEYFEYQDEVLEEIAKLIFEQVGKGSILKGSTGKIMIKEFQQVNAFLKEETFDKNIILLEIEKGQQDQNKSPKEEEKKNKNLQSQIKFQENLEFAESEIVGNLSEVNIENIFGKEKQSQEFISIQPIQLNCKNTSAEINENFKLLQNQLSQLLQNQNLQQQQIKKLENKIDNYLQYNSLNNMLISTSKGCDICQEKIYKSSDYNQIFITNALFVVITNFVHFVSLQENTPIIQ